MEYRPLATGELVQEGDECSLDGGRYWVGSRNVGKSQDTHCIYRRPIAEPLPLALDVSLEKARALHRVWRALNDGDCPKCHKYHPATAIYRGETFIQCPSCGFDIESEEIEAIEKMIAPAMDAAVAIFEQWRSENQGSFPA